MPLASSCRTMLESVSFPPTFSPLALGIFCSGICMLTNFNQNTVSVVIHAVTSSKGVLRLRCFVLVDLHDASILE